MCCGQRQLLLYLVNNHNGMLNIKLVHKLPNYIWNKEALPDQWKDFIIVPIYKWDHKTDYSNFQGMLLLSTTYKMLSSILLWRLTPYVDKINWDIQCRFWHNIWITDELFCIHQILEMKWSTNGTIHQPFIYTSGKPEGK
jgi:hypothetical protein